jgi:UDP-N-acetylmuramoylalanine--D-glutamate ligase
MSGPFDGERAVVVGFGASGRAASRALRDAGADVMVSEVRSEEQLAPEPGLDVKVLGGGHRPEHLNGATLVVVSPGIPQGAPVIAWARDRGLPVWSELEVGARLCRVPYVAITGTNGKTTTTEIVAAMMNAAGLRAKACGNVGYPFSTAAGEDLDALAVEASSFQLRFSETLRPRVSVLLNLAPDHLDWHGSFQAYGKAKAVIYAHQGPGDVHVGNADDPGARRISAAAPCEVRWFRGGPPGDGEVGIEDGSIVSRLGHRAELGRPVGTSLAFAGDVAAAAAAGLAFGLAEEVVAAGVVSAKPGPHRGTVVARLGSVAFIDDSKATNPHATLAALEGRSDVVLIAGGAAKGVDLEPLRAATDRLAAVIVLGQAAPRLLEVFDGLVPTRRVSSIEEAVAVAAELAPSDGTVLLAPACASTDMFHDYRERGDRFAEAAVRLVSGRHGQVQSNATQGGTR